MSKVITKTDVKEIHLTGEVIACDGDSDSSGHPKVYLHLDIEGKAICPYCDKILKVRN